MLSTTLDRRKRKSQYWNNGKLFLKMTRKKYELMERKLKERGEEIHALKNQVDKLDGQVAGLTKAMKDKGKEK